MKYFTNISILFMLMTISMLNAADRSANTVILDETGVKNLRIQTELVQKRIFETTVFVIGHLTEIPSNRSVLSTRIAGRVVKLNAYVGDVVAKDQVLVLIESRQPGNPPPIIELKAPRAGIVIESHISLGQPVEPDAELMDIADRSKLWALAHIPEPEIPNITSGSQARIHVPALGNTIIDSKMDRFATEANHKTSTLDGIFVIPNSKGKLLPGMRTEFSILTDRRKDVMSVPNSAIQGNQSRPVVFVKDFELHNAFVRAPVVLGQKNDRFTEIVRGLFPGDEVVSHGAYGLSFAGGGSGISLKEALDAAHGHEHNEDGSEITPGQSNNKASGNTGTKEMGGQKNQGLLLCIIAVGFILLAIAQHRWNRNRKS
jgi:cobalt-zinc-cadmium efflux system membrane fusion protein